MMKMALRTVFFSSCTTNKTLSLISRQIQGLRTEAVWKFPNARLLYAAFRDPIRHALFVIGRDKQDRHVLRAKLPNHLAAHPTGRDCRQNVAGEQSAWVEQMWRCRWTYVTTARPVKERLPSL